MGDDGGYEYVDWAADTGSGVDGVPGRYASPGCLGEDVGMLKASCVDDMAVRELRLFLPGEKRLVNQLMGKMCGRRDGDSLAGKERS